MFELTQIQNEIKAPKNQVNKFGNYNYRSVEDIQQALKPLLLNYNCLVTLTDEIVCIGTGPSISNGDSLTGGERYYVKATATFYDPKGNSMSVSALAREDFKKKGMSDSQVTGSASSYARKYALGGLLLLDDQKDSDSFNNN